MKIPKIIEQMVTMCVCAYSNLNVAIDDLNKRCEIKNTIAAVSNYDFVIVFDNVANKICEMRTTPYTETYLSLGRKAIELFKNGKEQSEVLYYFDELLRKEIEGK